MPEQPSRVRLQLGAELQTCRTLAGINQRDLAKLIGNISQPLLSRAEHGERILSRPTTVAFLRHTKAAKDVRDRILALTEAAHTETRVWADLLASQQHLQHVSRERNAAARLVQDFSPTVVPGLLQTADYARRIIPLADITGDVDHPAALAARIARQDVLTAPGDRQFRFLIAQRLLTWEPSPGVLAAQRAQLLTAAAAPNIEIAILPDSYAGALPWHNFVLRYPADGSPAYAAAELVDGEHLVEQPDAVAVYEQLWDLMWAGAARGDDAAALIRAAEPSSA